LKINFPAQSSKSNNFSPANKKEAAYSLLIKFNQKSVWPIVDFYACFFVLICLTFAMQRILILNFVVAFFIV
jgi:hypothetical protein